MNILEKLKLTDEHIKRLTKDGFDDPPDNTAVLLRVNKAEARVSSNNNICFEMEYSTVAWPSALSELRLGSPRVWDNGRLLTHFGDSDLIGQPLEFADKLNKRVAIWHKRLVAHGIHGGPLEEDGLTIEQAQQLAPLFVGAQTIARLRVYPADSEYKDKAGDTKKRQRTKLEIIEVEEVTPETLAKRGIVKPDVPF